jgi:alpha-beta hydrolase superfamily lysophospholipase
MQKKSKKKLWRLFELALVIYILIGVALYFFQDRLLFHPEKLDMDHPYSISIPFREVNVPVTEEKNLAIVQFTVPDSLCKGVVLYFHGNRRNIERYAQYATNFTKNNYEVWMLDYPGFGKSTGKRTEEIMYKDAAILYQMARARFSKDSIILYGKSMGTGVAAQLGTVRDCKRIILETPYYSIPMLFKHYAFMYPAGRMAICRFPIYLYLNSMDAPLSIFHGTDDEIIPYQQSVNLARLAKPGTELITIEKGRHNDLNDFRLFHEKLDSLLR